MKFDDIAGAVGDPGRRAQSFHSDVHPARLAEPERPGRVGGVQSGLGEKGMARGRVSAGNVEPKDRSAATCLPTSSASAAGGTPDASMIVAVMDRSQMRGERRMVVHGHAQDHGKSGHQEMSANDPKRTNRSISCQPSAVTTFVIECCTGQSRRRSAISKCLLKDLLQVPEHRR